MAAISAIPDMLSVVSGDYKATKYQAASAISRGTVLGLDTNGRAVPYPITGTPGGVMGVAMDSAAQYDYVTCVYQGIVNVANADDTTAIAIGKSVRVATFAGAVILSAAGAETNVIGTVQDKAIAGR
jgi:hypothetical protein